MHPLEGRTVVDHAIEYINDNLTNPIKLKDICNHLHISDSTLSKAFSKVMGTSVGKYIRITRIKHAELLIKTTDKSIHEISEEYGFSSAYHFSIAFKNIYGVPPSEYRLQNYL